MYQPLVPLLLESLRAQSLVPSSSLCTLGRLVLSFPRMACLTTAMRTIPNSFSPFPLQTHRFSNQISACLRDIQSWMDNHHLKLNPGKTELIFFPALTSPFSDFSISLGEATVTSSPSARNLGVVMDNRLSFSENITAVTRTCRFLLYKHPANPSIPHNPLDPAPRPSNGPVPPGLLQLPASRPPGICHQTATANPECCGTPDFQRSQIYAHHPAAH